MAVVDFNKILSGLTQSGVAAGLAGGVAGGALTSALSSKKGRKTASTLLKLGGVAAVGGLAWNAYRNYQEQQATKPPQTRPGEWQSLQAASFDVGKNDALQAGGNSLLIIRAMITAAMSDGYLDSAEQMRVFEHSDRLPLSNEDKAALFDELRNPQPLHRIVSTVDSPAVAVEVYTASLLVIDELTFEGQTYLKRLASLLNLPRDLVEAIHAETEAETPANRAA